VRAYHRRHPSDQHTGTHNAPGCRKLLQAWAVESKLINILQLARKFDRFITKGGHF
jgi:hypothetical protein